MPGRKKIEIDKIEFQKVVSALEQKETFSTRTILWEAVEASDWAKTRTPRPLTAQVALQKAEELQILIKTEKGKRGKSKGDTPAVVGKRTKRTFDISDIEKSIPIEERAKLAKTLEKAKTGGLKARVKLMCLDCTNWTKGEVSNCEITKCPLWDVRPYKKNFITLGEVVSS